MLSLFSQPLHIHTHWKLSLNVQWEGATHRTHQKGRIKWEFFLLGQQEEGWNVPPTACLGWFQSVALPCWDRSLSVVSAWPYDLSSNEQGHLIKISMKGGLTGKGFSTWNLESQKKMKRSARYLPGQQADKWPFMTGCRARILPVHKQKSLL